MYLECFSGTSRMDPVARVAMDFGARGVCMKVSGNSVLTARGNDNLPATVSYTLISIPVRPRKNSTGFQ